MMDKYDGYLVGGAITILQNMSSSMGRMTSHILWNKKKVWNHQPEMALSKEKAAMNHYGKRTGREVENHHLEVR